MKKIFTLLVCLSAVAPTAGYPCSFVQLGTHLDLAGGQNFDFPPEVEAGIVINPRNVAKSDGSFEGAPSAPPKEWVSRYGSITFGFGSGNPVTGVNEAGLRVYRFLFLEAEYPAPNAKPALNESLYVQYLLDTAKSVDEVIQKTEEIQIYTPRFPTHFAVCDREAACVVIEALKGKLRIFPASEVKVNAVTNTDYARALELYAQCDSTECKSISDESELRFVKAATQLKSFSGRDFKAGAFDILGSITQGGPRVASLWTMLSHATQSTNHFYVKNTKHAKTVFSMDLKEIDFSCKPPVKVALMSPASDAEVRLVEYTREFQERLATVLNQYLGVSLADKQKWIEYPGRFTRCLD